MSVTPSKPGGEHDQSQDPQSMVDSEANDLREMHLLATFLTPYSVAPKDNHVWLSNSQEDYADHTKQSTDNSMAPVLVKRKSDMASMIGFQGRAAGKLTTESNEKFIFSQHFEDYVKSRDRTFFRTKDHFSEYAEAKARAPSRSNNK